MEQVKILVIDDDEGMTELLTLLLSPASSEVIVANSGQEGIDLTKKRSPDVIILDLMMPGMNGWITCKEIRQFSDVPILILTAMDAPGVVAQALDVGADDYLLKPVSSGTLIAHLNRLVRRSKVSPATPPPTSTK
ncbi:MAG: DNA-binding response regulator [Chloroflexi bacterium]|nr:MAG: DNA-binding response regulator [Chloroflexota bacterium]